MKFQERIVQELKGSGLSQKEIANKLHIDPANITNWKKGKGFPSIQVLFELCQLLDVSSDYLLGLKD